MSNKGINWVMSLDRSRGYKSVLVVVANSANEYMASWPKRKTIAEKVGLKPDTVRDYLNQAVRDGDLIIVPWQARDGGDAAPGYFLGCVREMSAELPPLDMAFAKRINFRGPGKGGRPRDYTPSWWSGEKLGGGHRCTCCGGICRGDDAPETTADSEASADRNSTPETWPEQAWEIDPFDPGEGRVQSTQEGRSDPTREGLLDPTPLTNTSKPTVVTPQPGANAEAFARPSSLDSQGELSLGGGSGGRVETDAATSDASPSGLPAGHGAKAAPRERDMHQDTIGDDASPLRSDAETENRQLEREAIHSAIAALERASGLEQAHKTVEMALMAVEWAADGVREEARSQAVAAIKPPRWGNPDSRRYDYEVDAYTLEAALSSRPLSQWPRAVTEMLGLGAAAA